MAKLRLALSAIWYPMAIARYFEAALRRRSDIELITIGPYTGARIPWGNGMTLPQKYAKSPDYPIATYPSRLPVNFAEGQINESVDVWLQIDAGFCFVGRPSTGLNVIVATDPHVLNYDQQRGWADIFCCMQAEYSQADDYYLPYAYDPIWHRPPEKNERFESVYDAALIGLHYQERNDWVQRLRRGGLKILYDLGPVFDEARELYLQAPIGLNWSSKKDLVARVFELIGMGRLAIVNRVPDLDEFFIDGRDLIVCTSIEEATEKTLYYVENPDEGEKIAAQGAKTGRPHTWDSRVESLLKVIRANV